MDTECKGTRICEEGRCVNEAPPLATTPTQPAPATTSLTPLPTPAVASAAPAASSPRSWRRRSVPLLILGGVSAAAGAMFLAFGGLTAIGTADGHCPEGGCDQNSDSGHELMLAGGLLVAASIPMFVIGAQKVPADPRVGLGPWASPVAAGLQLRLEL